MNRGLRADGRRGLRSHGSPASTPTPSNKTKRPPPSTPGADKASKVVKKSSPSGKPQEEEKKSSLLPKKSIRIQLVSGNKKKPSSPKKSDVSPKKGPSLIPDGADKGSSDSQSSSGKVMTNSNKESPEKKDPASTRTRRSLRNLDSESDTKEVKTGTERNGDHTETDPNEDKKTGVKRKASQLENISVHEEKIPKSTDEKDLPVTETTKPVIKGKDSDRNTDMPKSSGLSSDGKNVVKEIKLYKMPNLPIGNQTGYKILVMANQDPKSGQIIQTSAIESASLVNKEKEEQARTLRTTRHSSSNQDESSKVKNEKSMEAEPSSETGGKSCVEASAITLLDLFDESKEKREPGNRVRIEVVKKPVDADKGSREPEQRLPHVTRKETLTTSEKNLIIELRKLLQKKTEEIARLKNELEWKDKQLEQMEELSQRNMELESKVALLLSNKEAYNEAEEAYSKEHSTTADQERPKRSRAKKEDGKVVDLTENNQSDEAESPETPEKPQRRRSSRRKKGEEEEKDTNIENLLVTISSDEEEQDDKKPSKKKAKSTEEKATQGDKKQTPKTARDDKGETATSKDEEDEDQSPGKGRHNIRKIYTDKKLASETKTAVIEERERLQRAKQAHRKHTRVDELDKKTKTMVTTKLILARDENDKPLVQVNSNLLQKLKPHQVDAVEFLWDTTVESLERLDSDPKGSGCILAHCMGLGKTLSVITLVHTLLKQSKHTSMATCLVVCPLNTVLNWQHEFNKWLPKKDRLTVYELSKPQTSALRCKQLLKWQEDGGVMIMGYQLFRHLVQYKGKSQKKKDTFHDTLLDPGPDLVVCDEGHILKNDASILSKCMSRIVTGRRIVLTGTPLQNNLVEYHCMVNFVKPNLLGNRREFSNRFVNPITNGQHSDSTARDVKVMKRRAHVLHEMLNGCVQRRDYSALTKLLPMKYEYVISVRLSEIQIKLYEGYLERCKSGNAVQPGGAAPVYTNRGASLFTDYQHLMRIWTHPWVLHMEEERQERKAILVSSDEEEDTDEEDSVIDVEEDEDTEEEDEDTQGDDDSDEEINFNPKHSPGRSTRNSNKESADSSGVRRSLRSRQRDDDITPRSVSTRSRPAENGAGSSKEPDDKPKLSRQWWSEMVTEEMEEQLELSGKLVLLMEILKMSYNIGDKVLVFSQSILSLDLIEKVLEQEQEVAESKKSKKKGSGVCQWLRDEDYHRMDGSTSPHLRKRYTSEFNNPDDKRMRLFLISTRAGGLGINLDAANRVIIFDASWNPSNDVQSIFRVYRFGQVKPVYVYRFLAQGTMEEKIYERQVTKETLSQRVIDEHQIDRHFSATDLQELYVFKPDRPEDTSEKPTPALPKDVILAELLTSQKDWISSYHEHDSLLENRPEENLTEEERKAAWEDYNKEKNMVQYYHRTLVTPQPFVSNIPGPSGGEPIKRAVTIPVGQVRPFGKGPSQLAATQIPRVVHEIMKYNPSISPQELQTRLSAFLGMHTPYKLNILQQGPTPNTAKLQVTGPSLPPGKIPGTKVPTTTTNLVIPINFQQTVSQTDQPTLTVPAVTQPQSATQQPVGNVSGIQQGTQKPQV